ncbi:hypothetical protein JFU47_26030 [Pseudomonas sp. TH39(2020)]|uniref:hypothetical protein n=1 Tax=Pseudomonas sp. TH39(2020) TaxID=2796349 RepID=UPI001911410E|nr:hypothetical protein [Pseudomonas sp. TH39(2020)]MBK5400146.1 hypothetical protein [Pseudomonas sp. TH39(2020)]
MSSLSLLSLFKARLVLLACTLLYAYSIYIAHAEYLSNVQFMWGFEVPSVDIYRVLVAIIFLAVPSCLLPSSISKPSSLFVFVTFLFVYVPSIVITIGNYTDSLDTYGSLLMAFCAGFSIVCLSSNVFGSDESPSRVVPSFYLGLGMLMVWLVFCAVLLNTYLPMMNFVGLDDIYQQRELGAATSLFMGYVQVYFAYMISPFLLSYGLLKKNVLYMIVAVIGFLIMFMITAERTVMLLPFVIVIVYMVCAKGLNGYKHVGMFVIFSSLLNFIISFFYLDSDVVDKLGFYFLTRTMALPGILFSQYYDLFSKFGFTYWSHVTGLGTLVGVPDAYADDAKWPMLGKIVAERVIGVESNSNASLFATDGAAAFGAVGVFVICVVFSLWLIVLDSVGNRWNRAFVISALFPVSYALTNGSFFTILSSFGGLLWVVLLLAASRKNKFQQT